MFLALNLFLNEVNALPVQMLDASGNELTGLPASGVGILTSLNGTPLASFVPASGTWVELGHGLYNLNAPASQFTAEGPFVYRVAPIAGGQAFQGFGNVQHRLDQVECCVNVQYDEGTQLFAADVWLKKNGQLQANPLTCSLTAKDPLGNTVGPWTGAAPQLNADGVFVLTASSVVFSLNTAWEFKIVITDSNGAVRTSIKGGISFN